jgi:hypothetical protein
MGTAAQIPPLGEGYSSLVGKLTEEKPGLTQLNCAEIQAAYPANPQRPN